MILVDTSAWVEWDRATGSRADLAVDTLIRTEDAAVTEPIVAEVLIGARSDEREYDLRRLLSRCHLVPFDPTVHFNGAVRHYRACRRQGVTPRGLVDCMIAAVATATDVEVLAHDADFARLADCVRLRLHPGSLRA